MGLWVPRTEAELADALRSKEFPEGHHLDFKRELGTTPASRKETAQDLASFAIDGGVLIVGVNEPANDTFELSPQPLSGLSERAEQIASNRPDPGLHVRTHVLPSESDPDAGYLIIEVPPSPGAPHMVDGRYWGRSERTKRQLGDAEVVRLHAARERQVARVEQALDEEIDREPVPRPSGRIILVAEPLTAPPAIARQLVRGDLSAVMKLLHSAQVPPSVSEVYPHTYDAHTITSRAKGAALTNLSEGRTVAGGMDPGDALDMEVQVHGGIRVLAGPLTYEVAKPRAEGMMPLLIDGAVVAWTHRLLHWAVVFGERLGYFGPWGLGVEVVGITGVRAAPTGDTSWPRTASLLWHSPVFEQTRHTATTTATRAELQDDPNAIADRLIGDFLDAVGAYGRYPDAFPPVHSPFDKS